MPALIVNADDLGHSDGVNRGILEAHKKGIVTSTSAMVNYPDAPAGIELLLREGPYMGIGLHLNLTSGRPVSPPEEVPSLVDDSGLFHHHAAWGTAFAGLQADDIERELRAQMARFIALAGKPPTHLDSHHHAVYMIPPALRVMLALAAEYSLPIRRASVAKRPSDTALHWLYRDLPPMKARAAAEEVHGILAASPGIRQPDRFADTFYDQHAILGELLTILTTLPAEGITELMCHPGYAEGLDSAYTAQREQELMWLTHPAAHEVVVAENIRLVSFAELAG